MKQIKINGIPYNLISRNEKEDNPYPHIENALTNQTPTGDQKSILRTFLADNGVQTPSSINTHSCVEQLTEIADRINASRMGTFDSWTIKSNLVCAKKTDKSFFDYNGSGIPKDIRWFFGVDKLELGGKKNILLIYKGKEYSASIQRENEHARTRLFWNSDLAEMVSGYNNPESYPIALFTQLADTKYEMQMIGDAAVSGIDYIGVLNYLENNMEVPYSNPEDPGISANEKDRLLKVKEKGQWVVAEMKKMADACRQKYNLDKCLPLSWLDGSNTKTRKYLWAQMKYSQYADDPISISIFVEKNGTLGTRYRISLEIKNDGTDKKTMERYHSYLDIPIDNDAGFVFVSGSNEWGNPEELKKPQNEIREQLRNGELRKVQLCRYIERPSDESNEYYHEKLLAAVGELIPYYEYVIGLTEPEIEVKAEEAQSMNKEIGLNTILYGPPGTGKTYNSMIYAVAIIEGKETKEVYAEASDNYEAVKARYEAYKEENQIAFTTFHQSYGYEEFIEGIRPVMDSDKDDISYTVEPGIFKVFCDKARSKIDAPDIEINNDATSWYIKIYPDEKKTAQEILDFCIEEGTIRMDFTEEEIKNSALGGKDEHEFLRWYKYDIEPGDYVLASLGHGIIRAVGIFEEGDAFWDDKLDSHHFARKVKWLAYDMSADLKEYNNGIAFPRFVISRLKNCVPSNVQRMLIDSGAYKELKNDKRYVFIIDEINRGNISKIFGELITLIETTKRSGEKEAMEAILPYSKTPFSVPDNVYILGTMNTADRSIALMDTALRRRFDFVEKMPDPGLLRGITVSDGNTSVNVEELLRVINQRIEYLFDREHTIGHAFFMKLRDNPSLKTLSDIFKNNVIPLLQEYFYEDYEKIQLVLGDNGKSSSEYAFVKEEDYDLRKVFKGNPTSIDTLDISGRKYKVQMSACDYIQSYKEISDTI
ncbi:McrB family protein [Butyrivibrio sp. MB2005]|uniref:McrB family protein n=1 Tax=Butyrivibrio sp. MB2005 TaxID=1280678 RepID=UPI00068836C7|nr:AAA family ATPase [Butyrivibrio sp. MB2005]